MEGRALAGACGHPLSAQVTVEGEGHDVTLVLCAMGPPCSWLTGFVPVLWKDLFPRPLPSWPAPGLCVFEGREVCKAALESYREMRGSATNFTEEARSIL